MKIRWYDWIIWLLILSSILLSCVEVELFLHQEIKFKIHKGYHDSGLHFEGFPKNNHLRFEATFNSSAIYTTKDPANQSDINKLFGFSDCTSPHHENSARFGWAWQDKLNIYAYVYNEGKVTNQLITSVNIDQVYKYEIIIDDAKYTFNINGKSIEMSRGCNKGVKAYLYPYFGGTEVAPHDMVIKVKIVK